MKDEKRMASAVPEVHLNGTSIVVERAERDLDSDDDEANEAKAEEDYKIDKLFYRICYLGANVSSVHQFSMVLGVNFYQDRSPAMRRISMAIVLFNCCINLYFIGYVSYLCLNKPFEADRVATSIALCTWVLQATLSTLFLAFWQSTGQPSKVLKLLYDANKGLGIHYNRKQLNSIVHTFYVVLGLIICYYAGHIIINVFGKTVGYMDKDIPMIFGDRCLYIIVQLANLYCILCWGVALFIFSLLVHSAHYEFDYFNERVRSMKFNSDQTDEALCKHMLKLLKIHNRLTECVKRLDQMFHRYAFVMIATLIPTTIFSLFIVARRPEKAICLYCRLPLVCLCMFSFITIVSAPSKLHDTIYNTKSALCANVHIWFPYRPNVYHSALAFVCHLDQTNLGVSIWGFAVVSKPLVLTTISVMVTCLALFLQVGDVGAPQTDSYFETTPSL